MDKRKASTLPSSNILPVVAIVDGHIDDFRHNKEVNVHTSKHTVVNSNTAGSSNNLFNQIHPPNIHSMGISPLLYIQKKKTSDIYNQLKYLTHDAS
jgi:hypothetical protein